jgi:hypothetical protein
MYCWYCIFYIYDDPSYVRLGCCMNEIGFAAISDKSATRLPAAELCCLAFG